MPKIVVDSSVVIKWFAPEPLMEEADKILQAYLSNDATLCIPDLLYAEIGNIVWKKQRFQGLSSADAREILTLFGNLQFEEFASSQLLLDAFQIATTYERTVYDSLYIALSKQENCPFVTADKKLVNAVQGSFPNVLWLPEWQTSGT